MHDQAFRAAAAALIVLAGLGTVQAQQVVRIGHAGPTTGPIAHLGKDSENGARLAIDALNAKGVVIGGQPVRFALQAEDDGADPRQGASVAQKLVDAKVNGVVGHFNSGVSIPAARIYANAGIAQVSPAATSPKYTQQGLPTTFRVVANDVQIGRALARHAAQQLHARRIAVIDDRTAYGQGLADEFTKAIRTHPGISVVSQQYTTDRATDFSAILTAIKATAPQVIFYGGMDAVAGPLLRQMRQLGIDATLVGGGGICNDALPGLAGGSIADDRVVCALPGGVEPDRAADLDAFKRAYRKQFGTDVLWVAAYAHDAVMVLVDAMQRAGTTAPDKYLPALARSRYQGSTGLLAFDEHGDLRDAAVTLYVFRGGARNQIGIIR